MSIINGTNTEIFTGRMSDPGCFICGDTKQRVEQIGRERGIAPEKISRMLHQAADPDLYARDLWRTTVGGVRFTFHLARRKVELRRADRM